jgi:hypothetical protein
MNMKLMQQLNPEHGIDLDLGMANELRVPKREVPAHVTFLYAPQNPQSCIFFLNYYSPQRRGEESLAEYLDSMDSFLPLRDKVSGEFFIVHVNQIVMVREASVTEAVGGRPLSLVLENGDQLALHTVDPRHAWRARPIDLLNEPGRFAPFIAADHARVHINKRFIVRVEGI